MPCTTLNFLLNKKILNVTKLKAFEDDKINEAQMKISVFDREENIVGKGEHAGNQQQNKSSSNDFCLWFPAFSPFPTMILKGFFPWRSLKIGIML